jgi:hypothetical protein
MTLTTVNRLITAGIAIPVLVAVWGATSSNPYLVILVALIAAAISIALVLTGTLVGGVKIIRRNAQPRTRDLFFIAVGANVLLLAIAIGLMAFGGKGA